MHRPWTDPPLYESWDKIRQRPRRSRSYPASSAVASFWGESSWLCNCMRCYFVSLIFFLFVTAQTTDGFYLVVFEELYVLINPFYWFVYVCIKDFFVKLDVNQLSVWQTARSLLPLWMQNERGDLLARIFCKIYYECETPANATTGRAVKLLKKKFSSRFSCSKIDIVVCGKKYTETSERDTALDKRGKKRLMTT